MLTFPQSTRVNQRIPLEELKRQKVDRKIVEQIKAVEWAYKLAPSTLNLAATETIKEVTVLRITLREGVDSWRQRAVVFSALDAAIRSPLIFLVFDECGDALGVALNLKASSGTLSGDSRLFRLFYTENEVTLPSGVTTLESFYLHLAASIGGLSLRPGETLRALNERHYRLQSLRDTSDKLAKRIRNEQQLNLRFELAKERKALEQEIALCQSSNA